MFTKMTMTTYSLTYSHSNLPTINEQMYILSLWLWCQIREYAVLYILQSRYCTATWYIYRV